MGKFTVTIQHENEGKLIEEVFSLDGTGEAVNIFQRPEGVGRRKDGSFKPLRSTFLNHQPDGSVVRDVRVDG